MLIQEETPAGSRLVSGLFSGGRGRAGARGFSPLQRPNHRQAHDPTDPACPHKVKRRERRAPLRSAPVPRQCHEDFNRAFFMKLVDFIEEIPVFFPFEKGGIDFLREKTTPTLIPAFSPGERGIAGRRNAVQGGQWSDALRPKPGKRSAAALSRV